MSCNIFWLVVWLPFFFPYIGNNHPNWLIFFRGVAHNHQPDLVTYLKVVVVIHPRDQWCNPCVKPQTSCWSLTGKILEHPSTVGLFWWLRNSFSLRTWSFFLMLGNPPIFETSRHGQAWISGPLPPVMNCRKSPSLREHSSSRVSLATFGGILLP